MYMNLCPQTVGMGNASFRELVSLANKHGFEGIDLPTHEVTTISQAEQAAEEIKAAGLNWGLFSLPMDYLQGDDTSFAEGLVRLEGILPTVKAAGCTRAYNHVWPGSNTMEFKENFKWHVERLKKLTDLLGRYNVRLGLEFIGPKTLRDSFKYPFIYSLVQVAELAEAVSPDLGLVIDCFHWYTSGGTLDDLRDSLTGRHIVNVHVNDAVFGRTREEQLDLERAMPLSTGIIDAVGVVKILRALKYDGPVICEPFNPTIGRLKALPNEQAAGEVAERMKDLFRKSQE